MTLIVACGHEERAGAAPLLERLGCRVLDRPLGPVPVRHKLGPQAFARTRRQPQFSEAWALQPTEGAWERVYTWEGQDLVIRKKIGRGQAVVIGDTQFLWNRTLEAEKEGWPGNIRFLSQILQKK